MFNIDFLELPPFFVCNFMWNGRKKLEMATTKGTKINKFKWLTIWS